MPSPTLRFSDMLCSLDEGRNRMNHLASGQRPFLFITDAWARRCFVEELNTAAGADILWDFEGRGNMPFKGTAPGDFRFAAAVPSRDTYSRGFKILRSGQIAGETYLANLTFPSELDCSLSLEDIVFAARARFRLLVPGRFTVFSPERFVRIRETGEISSFPMKGTIDASLPDAERRILNDSKEAAEHVTVVDLIRNDIGRVADRVEVPRYRYITEAGGSGRRLLQVSSEVRGSLGRDWPCRFGDILVKLLPAGSVTGAPKRRTCELLREAEGYDRNWYTGVFGIFDGRTVDSAVSIRFVEQKEDGMMMYKSGGGITIYSDMDTEYAELEAKIYAPFT